MPYGAPDLQAAAPRHISRAALAACLLWLAIYIAAAVVVGQQPRLVTVRVRPIELIPDVPNVPPPLDPRFEMPPAGRIAPTREPAIPIPVPDPEAVPVQPEFSSAPTSGESDPLGPGVVPGPVVPVVPAIVDPPPFDWIRHDVEAVEVSQVKPEYPELARAAQVEGLVVIRALVGTDGRVKRTLVIRSVPLLDLAARDAMMRWLFTPALDQGRPVAVWVSVPFRFTLR
jgi:protein TonB